MIKYIVLLFFVIVIYAEMTWYLHKKKNKFNRIPDDLEIINLGSTYAYYDFDYTEEQKGFNAALVPQYLYYDYVILQKYIHKIKKGGKVLIVLPDFIFAVNGRDKTHNMYYEFLNRKNIYDWKWKTYFNIRWRVMKEPFTHDMKKQVEKWKGYVASDDEKIRHADIRINDWKKNIGIDETGKGDIPLKMNRIIDDNIRILVDMINYCIEKKVEPIIIIPPNSHVMNERLSNRCMEIYLMEPIRKALELADKEVKILDYRQKQQFQSLDLYMNSDCLNEKGRRYFMDVVKKDTLS